MWVFCLVCFWFFVDVVTDWTMYRSFTRSLLKPLNLQAATYALISQLTLVCNMQLNVLDELAEAMKALDRKKRVATNFLFVVLRGSFLLLLLFGVFGVVAVFFFALVSWVLAVCSISPRFPLPPHPPWFVLCAFWSCQCSAGPSLRVSGCICNGPVVIPSIWRVVADWLLSSLLLMATKASALCGALPSPPCCGCCSSASRTCTEVFALG